MKANEAPEKLYLSKNIYSTYLYQVPDPDDETAVEYTRTDAFIEKACEFLSKSSNYNEGFIYPSHSGVIDAFVNNFKNYIKGE